MTKRVLITGATGFFGRHMCDYLHRLDENVDVICTVKDNVKSKNIYCDNFVVADLSCNKTVEDLIKQSKPDYIIHLAGVFGNKDYPELYRGNVLSTAVLLEAVRNYMPDVVMTITGSAAEYGHIDSDQLPVDEQTICQPVNLYGLTKYLATQIALYYHRIHNIHIMIIRPFQLIGKGVQPHLAPGAFAMQLKQTIAKGSTTVKVGNLESSRDFLDINDAVEATWALCRKPAPGNIFNLCSGRPTKIAELLQTMIDYCQIDVKIEVDPSRLKGKADVSTIYGSYQKILNHCSWQPKRSLVQSIQEMFD